MDPKPSPPPANSGRNDPEPTPGPAAPATVDLVRRAQAGDRSAVNELLARYQSLLLRVARKKMGQQMRGVMESMDLVQRANEVALRKLEQFEIREDGAFLGWLIRILENQVRDAGKELHRGKRDVDRELSLAALIPPDASSLTFDLAGSDPSPSQNAARTELSGIYEQCIDELEADHRAVVRWIELEQLPWEEVTRRLGRPNVNATKELYRRARVKLAVSFSRRMGASENDSG